MLRKNFNHNWKLIKGSTSSMLSMLIGGGDMSSVELPHDAMIHEELDPNTKNGSQTGFFPGGEYVYLKAVNVPEEWKEKTVILGFEGVYQTAMIYVNGNLAAHNLDGYSNFYVVLDSYLEYGKKMKLKSLQIIQENRIADGILEVVSIEM